MARASWDCERGSGSGARSSQEAGRKGPRDTPTLTPGCHDAMFPRAGLPMSGVPLTVLCLSVLIVAGLDEPGKSSDRSSERTRDRAARDTVAILRSYSVQRRAEPAAIKVYA